MLIMMFHKLTFKEMRTIYHCFFEQSGTFKNEFRKLGYEAEDYDIQNEFGETDHVIDLFQEIRNAYDNKPSVFDIIAGGGTDTIIAFYPCIRFEHQARMLFKGIQRQLINLSDEEKLEYDLKVHEELTELYNDVTKLAIVCIKKNIPLIIEQPYKSTHYLTQYWAIQPQVIDTDRRKRGDFFEKPTQYWFINRKPSQNMIFEAQISNDTKFVEKLNKTNRSMISKDYANRFIKEFIL